jgi:hypothetical protein
MKIPNTSTQAITSPKTMLTVVWNPHGFHLVNVLPNGQKRMNQYSIDHIFSEIGALRDAKDQRKLVIHADNSNPHVTKRAKQYLDENALRSAPHPPHSRGPSASDCSLFDHVRRVLQGTEFQTAEGLPEAVVQILSDIPLERLMATFH